MNRRQNKAETMVGEKRKDREILTRDKWENQTDLASHSLDNWQRQTSSNRFKTHRVGWVSIHLFKTSTLFALRKTNEISWKNPGQILKFCLKIPFSSIWLSGDENWIFSEKKLFQSIMFARQCNPDTKRRRHFECIKRRYVAYSRKHFFPTMFLNSFSDQNTEQKTSLSVL